MHKYRRIQEIHGINRSSLVFKKQQLEKCHDLFCCDWACHFGCVNAVEYSNRDGKLLASGGDDKRVLLWNLGEGLFLPNYKPIVMEGNHISNIFCLAFDWNNNKLFSSGNDEQVLVHDIATGKATRVYIRDDAVYSLSSHPNNINIFATASEDGRIHVSDMRIRTHAGTMCLANYISAFHGVAFNPLEPLFVAGAHSVNGAGLWDIRKPKKVLLQYGLPHQKESTMSVCFNEVGSQLLILRRRLSPRIYNTHNVTPLVDFNAEDYLNSCTMKSGCFAGENDEYIVSGSDNFNIFIWKIPDETMKENSLPVIAKEAKMILKGHRSIVNQVRYNKESQTLVSSGVEKTIKLWSPLKYPGATGQIEKPSEDRARALYSSNEYLDLMLQSGISSLNCENENTREDPSMMAFFDSLLQHDRNRSSDSSSDEEISAVRLLPTIMATSSRFHERSDLSSRESSSTDEDENNEDYLAISSILLQRFANNEVDTRERTQEERERLSRLQSLRKSILKDTEGELGDVTEHAQTSACDENEVCHKLKVDASVSNSKLDKTKKQDSQLPPDFRDAPTTKGLITACSHTFSYSTHDTCEGCTSKCEEKTLKTICISNKDGDSSCDDHSEMRKRVAARLKNKRKWVSGRKKFNNTNTPSSSSCNNTLKSALSHNTGALDIRKLERLADCGMHNTEESEERTSLGQAAPCNNVVGEVDEILSAYQLSAAKLNRSIVETDKRLAEVAVEMATAMVMDERDEQNLLSISNSHEIKMSDVGKNNDVSTNIDT